MMVLEMVPLRNEGAVARLEAVAISSVTPWGSTAGGGFGRGGPVLLETMLRRTSRREHFPPPLLSYSFCI